MTFQETIDQFVSDAAYRIGELGMELDKLADNSNHEYYYLKDMRGELSMFLSILRHTTMSIYDGTNFLDWTEYAILKECDYLRRRAKMNILPIMYFTNHAVLLTITQISVTSGTGGSGIGITFPQGAIGDTLFYNAAGNLYAAGINPYAGAGSDSITAYFAGRI